MTAAALRQSWAPDVRSAARAERSALLRRGQPRGARCVVGWAVPRRSVWSNASTPRMSRWTSLHQSCADPLGDADRAGVSPAHARSIAPNARTSLRWARGESAGDGDGVAVPQNLLADRERGV